MYPDTVLYLSVGSAQEIQAPVRAAWPKRVSLATLMAVVATQLWIGGPLLALWVGSWFQTRSGGSLTIRPTTALATFAALAIITFVLMRILHTVSKAYDRAAGVGPAKRRHDSWMGAERRNVPGQRPSLTTLERILVVVVAMAAIAFEVWFFFFSASPIDQRTGRSAVPLADTRSLSGKHALLAPPEEAQADRQRAEQAD